MTVIAFQILLISILAGLFGALVGLGGGIIVTPALTMLFGVDIQYAIGASLIAVIATSCGGAISFMKENVVNIRIGMFLEVGTTLGAISGAFLAGIFSSKALYFIFGFFMLYSAWEMYRKMKKFSGDVPEGVETHKIASKLEMNSSYHDKVYDEHFHYKVAGVDKSLFGIYFAGIMSGLLGIGGGSLKVLIMDSFMKLPLKVSTATSNFMIGVTAAASATVYYFRGDIDPKIAAPVALGVLIGALIGGQVMQRLKNNIIRNIFIPVMVIVAVQMLWKGWGL